MLAGTVGGRYNRCSQREAGAEERPWSDPSGEAGGEGSAAPRPDSHRGREADALREEWPELAEWVEAVVALVDRFRCSRTCWSEPVFALTSFARHDPVDLV